MRIARHAFPGPKGFRLFAGLSHGWQYLRAGVKPVNVSLYLQAAGTMRVLTLWWT
jgi:hypothetical protein